MNERIQSLSISKAVIHISTCRKRALSVSLYPTKNSRDAGVRGVSTKIRMTSSRKMTPPYSHSPRMTCVSLEIAPNRSRNSAAVSPSDRRGIDVPSLNRVGSRISNRRKKLISGPPDDLVNNAFPIQQRQCSFRHCGLAVPPSLQRDILQHQKTERIEFGISIVEADESH